MKAFHDGEGDLDPNFLMFVGADEPQDR
jgi:hypothetical protein